jgi:hypothetical protein
MSSACGSEKGTPLSSTGGSSGSPAGGAMSSGGSGTGGSSSGVGGAQQGSGGRQGTGGASGTGGNPVAGGASGTGGQAERLVQAAGQALVTPASQTQHPAQVVATDRAAAAPLAEPGRTLVEAPERTLEPRHRGQPKRAISPSIRRSSTRLWTVLG